MGSKQMKTIMEAKRIRSSSRKPLSDCTNSIHSIKPSLSSSTSTKISSSHIKSSKFLPTNAETTEQSETQAKSTSGSTATGQIGNHSLKSSTISLPVTSTPSRDPKPSSLAGTASHEVSEPCSVYSRRESIDKRKSKGKAVDVPMSCFPSAKNQFTRDEMNEGGTTRLSKSCTVPYKKKRRQTTPKEDVANHCLTQDFIEQQRAYFAEIDAFDLPEEEVASIDDLD